MFLTGIIDVKNNIGYRYWFKFQNQVLGLTLSHSIGITGIGSIRRSLKRIVRLVLVRLRFDMKAGTFAPRELSRLSVKVLPCQGRGRVMFSGMKVHWQESS